MYLVVLKCQQLLCLTTRAGSNRRVSAQLIHAKLRARDIVKKQFFQGRLPLQKALLQLVGGSRSLRTSALRRQSCSHKSHNRPFHSATALPLYLLRSCTFWPSCALCGKPTADCLRSTAASQPVLPEGP